jgi:hypothetical protein
MSDTELSDCVQKISLEDNNDAASSSSSSSSNSNSDDFDIEDVEALLKKGKVKNIVMVVGAGISTSAGIPDFRTPGTGLYRYFCNLMTNLTFEVTLRSTIFHIQKPSSTSNTSKRSPKHFTHCRKSFFLDSMHRQSPITSSLNLESLVY